MNMQWKEIEAPVASGRGKICGGDEGSLQVYTAPGHKGGEALVIVIPESLMKASGLRVGDGIEYVESNGRVGLMRNDSKPHHLSARMGGKAGAVRGKSVRSAVKRKLTPKLRRAWLGEAESRIAKAVSEDGLLHVDMAY